jgi:ABC-2 type transport system permease protein
MSDFWRLLKKELRELFRPRYLLPLLMAPLIFVVLAQGIGGVEQELADKPEIGIVNADGGELGATVNASLQRNAEVLYNATDGDVAGAVAAVRERGGEAVVSIPDGFTERIRNGGRGEIRSRQIIDTVSFFGIQSGLPSLIRAAGQEVTLQVTRATPEQLSPITLSETSVVKGQQLDASPAQLTTAFTSGGILFIPIVISVVVLFAGQMVMNSMGVENENKTLETLLTMPVKRRTIVMAKLVGSASIGLVGAGLYTASLFYYQSSFGGSAGAPAGVTLSLVDYGLIGVSLALSLVGALALALCLGLFADDRQGAQSLLLPLGAVSFVPVAVTLFTEVSALSLPLQIVLYLIPFTHPVIAPKLLLFGDPTMVYLGIAYEALFAAAMIALAVRIFDSDRIVTGSTGRLGQYLKFMQR